MKKLVTWLNLLFLLVGLFSIPVAMTSFMAFDAPGSENNTYLWVTVCCALLLPLFSFGAAIYSMFVCSRTQNYKKGLLALLLPTTIIVVMIICLTLIEIFCQGNFSC